MDAAGDGDDRVDLLKNVVGGLLVASLHINALSLFWALSQIADDISLQERIGSEGRELGNAPRRAVDTPLSYACIREAQRIKPVMAFIERQTTQPVILSGHRLEVGESVLFAPWLIQRSAQSWDNPLQFNPDNFARGTRPAVGSYFPFGLGPRQCPGTNLVNQQLTFSIAGVFTRLRLALHPDTRPGDLAPMFRVNLEPRGQVRLTVTPAHVTPEKEMP